MDTPPPATRAGGGVRPLPVTIPESGKAIYLTGVLPPARVAVALDVKAKRK